MAGYVRATWYLHAKYGSRMRGYAGELHGHGADNERHKYYVSKERRGVGVWCARVPWLEPIAHSQRKPLTNQ